jgi:succinoglycan biosynthesis transport protein ExoP
MNTQSLTPSQRSTEFLAITPELLSQPESSTQPQAGSLLDYWRTISRHKLKLAMFGLIGLGLGTSAALMQTPMFRASTSLEVQATRGDNPGAKILNPQLETQPADATSDLPTQIKILQSRSLIDLALTKAQISSESELSKPSLLASLWSKMSPTSVAPSNRDILIDDVTKHLKINAVSDTRIVEVSFEASEPAVAARFANVLTSEYIEQNLEGRLQMNRKTSDWLVSQLEDARTTLQRSEDDLQAYARRKGLIYTGEGQNISSDKLREVQSELSKAEADRVDKQSRFEIARTTPLATIPEVLNDPSLRALETNLVDLKKQEAEMAITFKPDYLQVRRLNAQIESLEANIASKQREIRARLDNEMKESERREELLSKAYAQQTHLVSDDSQNSIQYDMLKHDVDTNRQIYQVVLQRVKESSIASALKATNVRVLDPAKTPEHPYKPNLPMNAIAGLLLGLMVGIAGVVIGAKTDDFLNEPGQASMLLGIPELGFIPAAEVQPIFKLGGINTLLSKSKDGDEGPGLILSSNRGSMIADSYRSVAASIMFMTLKRRERVIVVTSPSPSEGKSTTTSNLAMSLANMGRKVLLIDGDIRSPRIHSAFGLDNSVGLTTTLEMVVINDMHTNTFIRPTAVPNLDVLTSGPGVPAAGDLLFSALMPALIKDFRDKYDIILIDTPPMLVMPDARALGRVADAVVLIARAGQTSRSALLAAHRRFSEDGTSVLGVVLNGWNSKLSVHKYYSAYKPLPEQALVRTT